MTGFLLGISFIIHIITLLSIIIVWKRSGAADQQELKAMKKEMEDILIAYTSEMKEENDSFLKELASMNEKKQVIKKSPAEEVIRTPMTNEKTTGEITVDHKPDYTPPTPPIEEEETFGPSLLSQVLSMQDQGYTLDEIAKKVKKGKGEVGLMLKFYRDGQ